MRPFLRLAATAVIVLFAGAATAHDAASPAAQAASAATARPQGEVAFANSGAPAAQADFLLGLAQLHNFQYREAAESFRRAQASGPGFAMAYWGEAMTYNHPLWHQQDGGAARAALAHLAPTPAARAAKAGTERERAYLAAVETLYDAPGDKAARDVAYARAMAALHARWPDDVDGTCFYALALMGQSQEGRDVPTYMQAAALMIELRPAQPRHPGAAHYLIHAVDDPVHAVLGLQAARAYAAIAPDADHAQHMTSHIFTALGLWDDVVASNESAMRVVERRWAASGKPAPGCGHYLSFLQYAQAQLGGAHEADARRLLETCRRVVTESPWKADGADRLSADGSSAASYVSELARYVIDAPHADLSVLDARPDLGDVPVAVFERDWLDAYLVLLGRRPGDAGAAIARAEASAVALSKAMDAADWGPAHPGRTTLAIHLELLQGLKAVRDGHLDDGLARLRHAAAAERAMPYEFGPPAVLAPSFEVLGQALQQAGRREAACAAFQDALRQGPNRRAGRDGVAATCS